MYRVSFALLIFALASLACSLSSGTSTTATSVPTSIAFATATQGTTPTVATAAPTATTSTTIATARPNCTVRTDWPIYTVVSGDTLGVIAQRTGSDVNTLVNANCLSNANSLNVGQQLRVPRIPVVVTTAPTFTPAPNVTTVGALTFDNYLDATERMWMLDPNTWTYVRWADVPRNQHGVAQFYLYVNGSPLLIGSDENLADGAEVLWLVPSGLQAKIEATFSPAGYGGVTAKSYQATVTSGNAPQPVGFPVISSYISADAGNFQLRPGETIQIRWFEVPAGTYAVDFLYIRPVGAVTTVIGSATPDQDGAIISWTVPSNLGGSVYAIAFSQSGNVLAQSYTQGVYSAAQ